MRKRLVVPVALWLLAVACLGPGGAQATTIRVDYSHDEFASYFLKFFPDHVSVAQGAELVFKQTWTGEPHTVTGGKLADKLGALMKPFFKLMREGKPLPGEPPKDILKAEEAVGFAFAEDDKLNQTLAQPCFLTSGTVPKKGKACAGQDQPEFDGTYDLYSSGIIPYEGAQGNEFRVKLADDIEPASYFFYCAVHGAPQGSFVDVKPKGSEVDTPQEIAKRSRAQIDPLADPLGKLLSQTKKTRGVTLGAPGETPIEITGNFAGLYKPPVWQAGINEFIPKRTSVKAGEKISWNVLGTHTISFDVPKYFPIIRFEKNGTVTLNPKLDPPDGGALQLPRPEGDHGDAEPSSGPALFDGGTWDGDGFWSSGRISGEPYLNYSMTITKPGTYKYACLVHPPMVGSVDVTA